MSTTYEGTYHEGARPYRIAAVSGDTRMELRNRPELEPFPGEIRYSTGLEWGSLTQDTVSAGCAIVAHATGCDATAKRIGMLFARRCLVPLDSRAGWIMTHADVIAHCEAITAQLRALFTHCAERRKPKLWPSVPTVREETLAEFRERLDDVRDLAPCDSDVREPNDWQRREYR